MIKDNIREKYNEDDYDITSSIGFITVLNMHGILPVELIDGRFKKCVYFKDKDYENVKNDWYRGKYDELKLFNKAYGKTKRMLYTGNINDLRMM